VDNEHVQHVVEAVDKLEHNLLHYYGGYFEFLQIHEFFQVTTIAVLHEDIVPAVRFNCLRHPNHVLAAYSVLVLDLRHDQAFLGVVQACPLDDLAGVDGRGVTKGLPKYLGLRQPRSR